MWWGHHAAFSPFCFLFLFLFIGLIIFAIMAFRRRRGYCGDINHVIKAEKILKQRLASGEITEEEYQRLKDTLAK